MPNRITREGWIRSRRCASTSLGGIVLWHALKSVADDYGRFSAEPYLVLAACFPRPRSVDQVTEKHVAAWLEELAQVRLLAFYQAGDDRLLQLFNFGQRARSGSKYPAPPVEVLDAIGELEDSVARRDAGKRSGNPETTIRQVLSNQLPAECPPNDRRMSAPCPPNDRGPRAARAHPAAVVVCEDVVEGVCGDVVGNGAPTHGPDPPDTGGSVVIPIHHEPPQARRPDGGCPTCLDVLSHFAERTGRAFPLAGRIAERLHRAHQDFDAEVCKRMVDQQHARALDGTDPRGWEFLSPQVIFEPANFARLVNTEKRPETDADRARQRMRDINRELGVSS
jgi:hypothetical protein